MQRDVDIPLGRKILFAAVMTVLVLGLVEIVLRIGGVDPVVDHDDPFVGFAGSELLFTERVLDDGTRVFVTAESKRGHFNVQRFAAEKPAGTLRVVCLGGSTTYGRPYDDRTSFAGWLRELLPEADPGRAVEVINAGGISYASYRVARIVDEMLAHEPDVLVIYTGHNEVDEERTYGAVRDR